MHTVNREILSNFNQGLVTESQKLASDRISSEGQMETTRDGWTSVEKCIQLTGSKLQSETFYVVHALSTNHQPLHLQTTKQCL